MPYELDDDEIIRSAFWAENPQASRKLIRSDDGRGKQYTTDTRVAFVDWLDNAERSGRVSPDLAQCVTLGRD